MTSYLTLNNNYTNSKGNLKISSFTIEQIAEFSLQKMDAVSTPKAKKYPKLLKKFDYFSLKEGVKCTFKDNRINLKIIVDIKKGSNIEEVCLKIQKTIADDLEILLENIPLNIKVKVEKII